jgi:hypothetical protein
MSFSASANAPKNLKNDSPNTICSICNIPDNLYTLNVTSTDATLLWEAAVDACSYNVRVREVGTTTWTFTGTVNTNAAMVSNLSAMKSYEWQVRTNCCDGTSSGYSDLSTFNTLLGCGLIAPANLTSTNVTNNAATISWSAVSGAVNYVLKYKVQGASNFQSVTVNGTTYTLTGLAAATNYDYLVVASGANCQSNPSLTSQFKTTGTAVCDAPNLPTISSITTNNCCIQWNNVASACSYTVKCRVVGTTTWTFIQQSAVNQFCIPNLTPLTQYECQVATNCCSGMMSSYCGSLFFTTDSPCTKPSGTKVSSITSTTAQVCWTGPSIATSYKIEYKPTNSSTWISATTNLTCYNLNGLNAATDYEVKVSSICTGFNNPSVPVTIPFTTISASPCSTPTGLMATNVTSSGFTITWNKVSGACTYNVRVREVGTTQWGMTSSTSINKLDYYMTKIGASYEFQVQTQCCSGGTSAYSPVVSTLLPTNCPTPTDIICTAVTNTSATISWTGGAGVISYNVLYKVATATSWSTVSTTTPSVNLFGLTQNTAYQVQILAICGTTSISVPSVVSTFTTTNIVNTCGIPTNCQVSLLTGTSCTLSWSVVSGACSYSIRVKLKGATTWLAVGNPTKNTCKLTGLSPNTSYEWQVLTNCCLGTKSDYCPLQPCITPSNCASPTNPVATAITAYSANLSWTAVTGAISYNVLYKPASAAAWSSITVTANTAVLSNLVPNTNYQFAVTTNCSATSQSAVSTICNFTTLQTVGCATPTGLFVQNITATAATLCWVAIPTACSYSVRYREQNSTANWTTVLATSNTLTVNNLTPGTLYEWNVSTNCCNSATPSTPSVTIPFTTIVSICVVNDDPCSAKVVTVGTSNWSCVPGTNVCATPTVNPVALNSCNYSPNDVWYKVTIPPTGFTTIAVCASQGLVPGVGIYYSESCTNLTFLGCKCAVTSGNLGAVAQISIQGPAGYTAWVRVWGAGNTTGNFNICAIDQVLCSPFGAEATTRSDEDKNVDVKIPSETSTVAITASTFDNEELEVFPNPATTEVGVKFFSNLTENEAANLIVYDMQGRKVKIQNIELINGINNVNIACENLSAGAYIIKVESSENFKPSRLIVRK